MLDRLILLRNVWLYDQTLRLGLIGKAEAWGVGKQNDWQAHCMLQEPGICYHVKALE